VSTPFTIISIPAIKSCLSSTTQRNNAPLAANEIQALSIYEFITLLAHNSFGLLVFSHIRSGD